MLKTLYVRKDFRNQAKINAATEGVTLQKYVESLIYEVSSEAAQKKLNDPMLENQSEPIEQ